MKTLAARDYLAAIKTEIEVKAMEAHEMPKVRLVEHLLKERMTLT
jgi:hypothetical protein